MIPSLTINASQIWLASHPFGCAGSAAATGTRPTEPAFFFFSGPRGVTGLAGWRPRRVVFFFLRLALVFSRPARAPSPRFVTADGVRVLEISAFLGVARSGGSAPARAPAANSRPWLWAGGGAAEGRCRRRPARQSAREGVGPRPPAGNHGAHPPGPPRPSRRLSRPSLSLSVCVCV